jgi:hypothetical protein
MFHSSFRYLFFVEDSYFIYVICIYFQQHDVRVVKQQEADVTSGAGTAYLYRASGFIKVFVA